MMRSAQAEEHNRPTSHQLQAAKAILASAKTEFQSALNGTKMELVNAREPSTPGANEDGDLLTIRCRAGFLMRPRVRALIREAQLSYPTSNVRYFEEPARFESYFSVVTQDSRVHHRLLSDLQALDHL